MDAIAGAINIAAPDPFKAKQNIAVKLRPNLFQFIGKADYRLRPQTPNRSKRPLVVRPLTCSDELNVVSGFYDSMRKSS